MCLAGGGAWSAWMTDALSGALLLWYILTAASVAFMVYDLAVNTPAMGVMKAAWILIALYLGPIGLAVYLLSCRQPLPDTHDAFIAAHWKQSVGSLAHCLAGDATGIILAAVFTHHFHFANGLDLILEYTAAFMFGWLIFQALFMKSMLGADYALALRKTFFAEFVSMNMVMVGMLPTMVILMHLLPESHDPMRPAFWGVMSVATLAGGITAYPINSWMVAHHIKHGMMSAPDKHAPMAMDNMKGMPSHTAATLPASTQLTVIVGTLALLVLAIYVTSRFAPITL
jgi:hypothetical protein